MKNIKVDNLSLVEVKVYNALLEKNSWKPSQLALAVNESRTNCYKILESLESKGLAIRVDTGKTLTYQAAHPSQLSKLAQDKLTEAQEQQTALAQAIPSLIQKYVQNYEQPGVTHYNGKEEIRKIYQDQALTGRTIFFINSTKGIDFYGFEEMSEIRQAPAKAGIKRIGIVPENSYAGLDFKQADLKSNLTRTWVSRKDYQAPVEWGCYGDKLYMITFGKEAVGIVIQNELIALSFRELFKLLDTGIKRDPNYDNLGPL